MERTPGPRRRDRPPLLGLVGLAAALAVGLAGCVDFDPRHPIALLVGPDWGEQRISLIADAAEAWNVELGTALEVTSASDLPQQVPVRRSKFVCSFAGGVADIVGADAIHLCELDIQDPWRMSRVVVHEIGHILGITSHADDPEAVMGTGALTYSFRDEDLRMFHEANEGFGERGCRVARRIGRSLNRPWLVQPPAARPVLLWAGADRLHQASHAPDTGEAEAPAPEIETVGRATFIRAIATEDGYLVCWRQAGTYRCAEVRDGKPSPAVALALDLAAAGDAIHDISLAVHANDLYVAVSQGGVTSTPTGSGGAIITFENGPLAVHRFDRASGARRQLAFEPRAQTSGQIAVVDGALLVAAANADPDHGLEVLRLAPDGTPLGSAFGFAFAPVTLGWALQVLPQPGGLLIARLRSTMRGSELVLDRVVVGADGALARGPSAILALPTRHESQTTMSIADLGGHAVAIAVPLERAHEIGDDYRRVFSTEVQVARVDAERLVLTAPFRRLSAPDSVDSINPLLAADGGRLVAIWRDWSLSSKEEHLVRSRCVRFDQ